MTAAPVRLGIIGAGIMGERMLRAALEHAAGLVQVTAVWDAAPTALDRLAPILPARASSAEAVIEAADCLYVATPPATHLAYADQAIAAGRAVFLEKPLATDTQAARAFVQRHAGARAAVNFPFASSFAVERLRSWLAEGAIGEPEALHIATDFATWPRPWQRAAASWLDAPAEGGFTREVVSHFLFLARRLLGPLTLLHATIDRPGGRPGDRPDDRPGGHTERHIEATLQAGGVPVHLRGGVGTVAADDSNSWTLTGARPGGLRLRDWSWAERRDAHGTWTPDPDAAPNERMRPLVLRRQLEGVACMTRGEPHGLATLQEAFDVQTIVESILAQPALHSVHG